MESQLTSTFLVGSSPPLAGLLPRASSSAPIRTRPRRSLCFPRSFMPSAQLRSDGPPLRLPRNALRKFNNFAAISSSSSQETTSVGVPPPLPVPPPSTVVSPLFWIGIGVGMSVLFSWGTSTLKKYAMQQAFKTMMEQIPQQNNQFNNAAFSTGSPMPFPTGPFPIPTPYSSPKTQTSATIDVSAANVETASVSEVKDPVINVVETEQVVKKSAFVDVSPNDVVENVPFEGSKEATVSDFSTAYTADNVSPNGTASNYEKNSSSSSSQSTQSPGSLLSVEALEKMMEDPTVQKMVYPYLPEEMRNPSTFKWMLQNPQYRQQLQDMINSMKGNTEWDRRMVESMQNFDLNSPELKQQFDQLGLSPEEVISKIMANPEVAMAFQNPRVQAAIMDCSQNPLSIAKYQNDKEVMDVFNKISELFPGVSGYP